MWGLYRAHRDIGLIMANRMDRNMESTSNDLRFRGTTVKKQINKNTKNEAAA